MQSTSLITLHRYIKCTIFVLHKRLTRINIQRRENNDCMRHFSPTHPWFFPSPLKPFLSSQLKSSEHGIPKEYHFGRCARTSKLPLHENERIAGVKLLRDTFLSGIFFCSPKRYCEISGIRCVALRTVDLSQPITPRMLARKNKIISRRIA